MDEDVQRREYIRGRLVEIKQEIDTLLDELGGLDADGRGAEDRRKKFTLIQGGGALVLVGAAASLAAWGSRHSRGLAAGMVAAGAVAVVAGALLGHSPPGLPHRGALGPSPRPRISAMIAPSAPIPSHTAAPKPPGRPSVPPLLIVPVRGRRPSASAPPTPTGTPTPPGSSTPTRTPTFSPSRTASPPAACPVGLALRVLVVGVSVCV